MGVVDSPADGVGDGEASGDEDAAGVVVAVGFTADAEVHPPRTMAMAMTAQA